MDSDRHIVLFRNLPLKLCLGLLKRQAGLDAVPFSTLRAGPLPARMTVFFDRLGVATVRADPDQVSALRKLDAIVAVESERSCQGREASCASGAAEAAGHTFPLEQTLPFSDSFFATWGLRAVRADTSPYTGRGVRIAILDTGLDFRHPDFAGRNCSAESFVGELTAQDDNGHGTFCAGVACGPLQPHHAPRYGVAPGAELFVARVLDERASGTDSDVLAGIDWAVRQGCAVISMSFGNPVLIGDRYPQVYEEVAARALAAGSVLIAPAGNTSQRPGTIAPVEHPGNWSMQACRSRRSPTEASIRTAAA
jgi:subtilisin